MDKQDALDDVYAHLGGTTRKNEQSAFAVLDEQLS